MTLQVSYYMLRYTRLNSYSQLVAPRRLLRLALSKNLGGKYVRNKHQTNYY